MLFGRNKRDFIQETAERNWASYVQTSLGHFSYPETWGHERPGRKCAAATGLLLQTQTGQRLQVARCPLTQAKRKQNSKLGYGAMMRSQV